ncbi:hexose kinase [Oscillochloris sp. ZM17-4]|uniref:1-phosphofructokinase family hexose kinase n=1 Tax=Oscillochloris sp. ZM17-4 TaxID=2866714 RepID=UPI001C72D214|nr:hexose kinase [Oscillochloris sp. ZM17-4]MBX0327955.1 hexose kinase [Oscillochloris sp. ZM17-4]
MLVIITPNPALDRTMVFPGLRLGAVQRTDDVVVAAGGKGLNVARAALTLGQPALLCAPIGGLTGDLVARLAEAEGLAGRWSRHAAGETRTCVLLVDPQGGDATALNESGPVFADSDWAAFADAAMAASADARLCLISGSLPRGVGAVRLGDLVGRLGAAGRRVIVDTSGAPLEAALAARPYGVKVNGAELGAALGRAELADVAGAASALAELRAGGLGLAAVSLGALGVVAVDDTGAWWACPPPIDLVSTVGSGDSLLAGLSTGLLRGLPLPEALRLGVACGSADALTIGGGRIELAEVERLAAGARVLSVEC